VALFNAEVDAFRAAALGPREKELLGQLEKDSSPARENQLGVLYAQFGLLGKALGRFESAVNRHQYLPAMVNAANVYSMQQEYGRAQEYLRRAQQIEPENARVLIALAFSLFQSGNESDAKSTYERMSRIDPRWPRATAVRRHRCLRRAGARRAKGKDPELFGADWLE